MANNGAIDLVVTRNALEQIKKLDSDLAKVEKRLLSISKGAIGQKGGSSSVSSQKQLSAEMKKQSSLLTQLVKNNKKYQQELLKVASAAKKAENGISGIGKSAKRSQSRVGSFFKTLVQFDLARRAVELFWGAFRRGFEDLKQLDSLRLQFQYLVKDAEEARVTMAFLARISDELGTKLLETSESYLAFRKSAELANLSGEKSRQVFEDVTRAATLLGKSPAQIQNVQVALEQMLSKGTVQAEELKKQLGNVLPGSFEIMAKAVDKLNPNLEVTNAEFMKMLKAGKIISADVLPEFAKQLNEAYGIENVSRIENMASEVVRLDNAFTIMVKNMEEGTGVMAKGLIFFFDVLRENVKLFGEMFLSAEQLANINKELNFESGFNEGGKIIEDWAKKYEGNLQKTTKQVAIFLTEEGRLLIKRRKDYEDLKTALKAEEDALFANPAKIDQLRDQMKLLAGEIGLSEGRIAGMNKAFEELFNTGADKDSQERAKAFALEGNKAEGLIEKLERVKKIYETMQKTTKDPLNAAGLKDSIDLVEGLIDILEGTDVAAEISEKALKDWTKTVKEELGKMAKAIEKDEDLMKQWMREYKRLLKEKENLEYDVIFGAADLAAAISDSIFAIRIEQIDQEMEKLQERYDLQRELIESEVSDEEARAARLKDLDLERRKQEKKLEKEREEAEKKAFLVNQAIQAGTVVAETAKGIAVATATYGSNPLTVALLPQVIALIATTGALQLATILAQSVPAFKEGHLSGTYEGVAMVNDGGVPEVIERRDGSYEIARGKNALINMAKGDKVHKSVEDFIENKGLMSHLLKAMPNAGHGIGGVRSTMNESLGIRNEIRDGFKNVKIRNDNRAVARIVAEAIRDNRYESKFL